MFKRKTSQFIFAPFLQSTKPPYISKDDGLQATDFNKKIKAKIRWPTKKISKSRHVGLKVKTDKAIKKK